MLAHDRFIALNGLRLHYRHWGHAPAPPVVLVHGGCAHAHWWDFFAGAIADAHEVFAIDLRGHGDSERPAPPAYRVEDYVDDLAEFAERLHLRRMHLVGHSLGAIVAAAFAGRAPERVHTLVLVDSQVRISPSGARYMARLRHFPHPVYRSHPQAVQRFRLLPAATTATPETLAHIATHSLRELPDGRWTLKFDRQSLAHTEPRELGSVLQRLPCPILLVRGAHSTVLPADKFHALLGAMSHVRGVEIPESHHHVMLDNPEAFLRAVRAFLHEHRTS